MNTYLGSSSTNIVKTLFRSQEAIALYIGTRQLGSEFSPLDLFAGGKQGVWYDPSDKSTLFQDVAGTVPVTKDGDPVALMLDKSQGAKTEYLYNKSVIDSLDGWYSREDRTNGNMVLTPEGIRAEFLGVGAGAYKQDNFIAIDLVLKKGVTYFFNASADRSELNSAPYLRLYDSDNNTVFTMSNIHTNPQQAFTPEKDMSVSCHVLSLAYNVSGVLLLKSLIIKSVAGNHATQTVSTARPIYKTDGILHWLQTDGVDDFLDSSLVPWNGSSFFQSSAMVITGGQANLGIFRFLREGGSPTSAVDNYLEEYTAPSSSSTRKAVTQRYPSVITVYDNYNAMFTKDTNLVSWNSNNAESFKTQIIPTQLSLIDTGFKSLGSGNATLTLFRGYGGGLMAGRMYGFIWVSDNVSDENRDKANSYLMSKSGVTL